MGATARLVPIGKREARQRWNAGDAIGVGNDRYGDHNGQSITHAELGWTFDELAARSVDSRRPSCVFWYRAEPVAEPAPATDPEPVATSTPCTLWGFSGDQREPIKLTAGSVEHCTAEHAARTASGWACAVYRTGAAPLGLRIRAAAAGWVPEPVCRMAGVTDNGTAWLGITCAVHGDDAAAYESGRFVNGERVRFVDTSPAAESARRAARDRAWLVHVDSVERARDIARQTADRLAAPYSATCTADSGTATDCQRICTAPAVSRVIVETACYPVSVSDVCARHVDYVRGRAYPTPSTVQDIPTR